MIWNNEQERKRLKSPAVEHTWLMICQLLLCDDSWWDDVWSLIQSFIAEKFTNTSGKSHVNKLFHFTT